MEIKTILFTGEPLQINIDDLLTLGLNFITLKVQTDRLLTLKLEKSDEAHDSNHNYSMILIQTVTDLGFSITSVYREASGLVISQKTGDGLEIKFNPSLGHILISKLAQQ